MRYVAATLLILALTGNAAVAASCDGGTDGTPSPTPTKPGALPANLTTITVTDYRFQPLSFQIPTGTRVTWSFRGDSEHGVIGTFNGKAIESGPMRSGNFEIEFTEPGEFNYTCAVHGAAMQGTVVVR